MSNQGIGMARMKKSGSRLGGNNPMPSFNSLFKGMARAAEELMDKLQIGHSALRSMRAALLAGDEDKALEEYAATDKSGKTLMEEMHPSTTFSVPRRHVETTALHLAAEQAMRRLVVLFLDHGADPNTRTSRNESAVHSVCRGTAGSYKDRLACLAAILEWSGPSVDGVREKASVNAVDAAGCTPVHHAARNGYTEIAKSLIARGANITIVTAEQETASDVAASSGHTGLANWLEAQIIFGEEWGPLTWGERDVEGSGRIKPEAELKEPDLEDSASTPDIPRPPPVSPFVSLSPEDLERRRDELVSWVAEALARRAHTALAQALTQTQKAGEGEEHGDDGGGKCAASPTAPKDDAHADKHEHEHEPGHDDEGVLAAVAEALLHSFHWDKTSLGAALEQEAVGALGRAGLEAYAAWWCEGGIGKASSASAGTPASASATELKCPICREDLPVSSLCVVPGPCAHAFCPQCLKNHVVYEIAEKGTQLLKCAEYTCGSLLPLPLVTRLLTERMSSAAEGKTEDGAEAEAEEADEPRPDLVERYANSRIRAFVEHADFLSNCPSPGCEWVVMHQHQHQPHLQPQHRQTPQLKSTGTSADHQQPAVPEGVEWRCSDGHRFCARCHSEPHAPCRCVAWRAWQQIVALETLKAQEDVKRKAILAGGGSSEKEAELLANALWISANTKDCPKCGTPIEKTSGCNHISCTQRSCKHEWCWICGSAWSLHNNQTGGFFRCNRFLETTGDVSASGGADSSMSMNSSSSFSAQGGGQLQHTGDASQSGGGSAGPASARAGGGGMGADDATGADPLDPIELLEALDMGSRPAHLNMTRANSNGTGAGAGLGVAEQLKRGSAVEEAKRMAEQSRRMARFIHHYTRFRAHEDSNNLERAQQDEIVSRVKSYVMCFGPDSSTTPHDHDSLSRGVGFVESAFEELYASRHVLRTSYAYAFFELASSKDMQGLVPGGSGVDPKSLLARPRKHQSRRVLQAKKHIFELHQSELEMLVESLSGTIDPPRRRLHASKAEIITQTAAVRQKRTEFEDVMARGIIPDDDDDGYSLLDSPSANPSGSSRGHGGRRRRSSVRSSLHAQGQGHGDALTMFGGEGQGQDGTGGRRSRFLQQLATELQGLGLDRRELELLAAMEEEAERSQGPHSLRSVPTVGPQASAYAQLQQDFMHSLETAGLSDVDVEVAMLDRAIRESLRPSTPPPASTSTSTHTDDANSTSSHAHAQAPMQLQQLPPLPTRPVESRARTLGDEVDVESEGSAPSPLNVPWECHMCTLVNEAGRRDCELCGTARAAESSATATLMGL